MGWDGKVGLPSKAGERCSCSLLSLSPQSREDPATRPTPNETCCGDVRE